MRRALMAAIIIAVCSCAAVAESTHPQPRIGYVFPAGGRVGSTVDLLIGGQVLRDATGAYVTGGGVRVVTIRNIGRLMNVNGDERREILVQLAPVMEKRGIEIPPMLRKVLDAGALPSLLSSPFRAARAARAAAAADATPASTASAKKPARNPLQPMLDNADDLSDRELDYAISEIFKPNDKKQPNNQLAETVFVELKIDATAVPGERELRLVTPLGLSNPMRFRVGVLPEACEPVAFGRKEAKGGPVTPPVILNGQVKAGDVDGWHVNCQKGQRLVIQAYARALNPFFADAVPGWFQAALALHDPAGREVAFADSWLFDQDPVILYEVPKSGQYELEVRDTLFRGRQDFVYRVSVTTKPFVESIFPLGGREGLATVATAAGWNLGSASLPLDTGPGPELRSTALRRPGAVSNAIAYCVDDLPEVTEVKPNNCYAEAQPINPPVIVNGRIDAPGDIDVFKFFGRADDKIAIEVTARRVGSPLDSLVRLLDSTGRVIAWNDDYEDKSDVLWMDAGVITHHADSYLMAALPASGSYYVEISDAQRHGGPEYAYRLRVSPPRPDFELAVTPSTVNVFGGALAPLAVYAIRKDGFDGAIDLSLKDAPAGYGLQGGRIPSDCTSIRMAIAAPPDAGAEPVALKMEGRARIGGQSVSRPVVPCEDMMQAFLYRQLVPSKEFVVAVAGRGRGLPPASLVDAGPVRIAPGGDASVRVAMRHLPAAPQFQFELDDPPSGLSIQNSSFGAETFTLSLHADAKTSPGLKGNLIVNVILERDAGQPGNPSGQKRRIAVGVLPPIPFEITEKPKSSTSSTAPGAAT